MGVVAAHATWEARCSQTHASPLAVDASDDLGVCCNEAPTVQKG
jgi:hypothetical protein